MKRRRNEYPKRLPDIITSPVSDNFTTIPNKIIRDKGLSWKAKGILCLLLGNKDNEWYSYKKTITNFGTDGEMAVNSGIKELEKHGYLIRLRYRDKIKKAIRGSMWICTPFQRYFDWKLVTERLDKHKLEPVKNQENLTSENPQFNYLNEETPQSIKPPLGEPPIQGNPYSGVSKSNNTNYNNTNYKEDNNIILSDPTGSDDDIAENDTSSNGANRPTIQERNKEHIPLANKLAEIIRTNKDVKVNQFKIEAWSNEIRKIVESDGITPKRIETALDWYKSNIGGDYVPVIESGAALRSKFIKLENAIERDSNPNKSKQTPKQGAYRDYTHYPPANTDRGRAILNGDEEVT